MDLSMVEFFGVLQMGDNGEQTEFAIDSSHLPGPSAGNVKRGRV